MKLNFWIGSSGSVAWARQGLSYQTDEIVRFFYCKTNDRSQQPHKSDDQIIFACYFARQKLKLNMFSDKQSTNSAKQKEKKSSFSLATSVFEMT